MLRMSQLIYSFVCMCLLISMPVTVSSNWKLENDEQTRSEIVCMHLPDSHSNMTEIHAALLKHNINTAWLNTRRVTGKWKWLDGSEAGKQSGPPGRHRTRHHGGCALLDAWDNRTYAFGCHLPGVTALCQAKHCRVCKEYGKQKPLFQHTGKYCHYFVNASSWYHAKSLCLEDEDSKLAVLSDPSLRRSVSRAIVNSRHYLKYGNYFWIGLHQEDWRDENGKGKPISSSRFHVVENAFRSPRGECLVATVHKNKLGWSVVKCSRKHPVLCRKKRTDSQQNGIERTITPVPPEKRSIEEENKGAVIPAAQESSSSAYRRIPDPRILIMTCFYLICSGAMN